MNTYLSIWLFLRPFLLNRFKTQPLTSCSFSWIPDLNESSTLHPSKKAEKSGVSSGLLSVPGAPQPSYHQILSILTHSSLKCSSMFCISIVRLHAISFTNVSWLPQSCSCRSDLCTFQKIHLIIALFCLKVSSLPSRKKNLNSLEGHIYLSISTIVSHPYFIIVFILNALFSSFLFLESTHLSQFDPAHCRWMNVGSSQRKACREGGVELTNSWGRNKVEKDTWDRRNDMCRSVSKLAVFRELKWFRAARKWKVRYGTLCHEPCSEL